MDIIYIRLNRHCRVVAPLGGQQEKPQVVGQSPSLPQLGDRHAPLYHWRGALQRCYCWGKPVPQHSTSPTGGLLLVSKIKHGYSSVCNSLQLTQLNPGGALMGLGLGAPGVGGAGGAPAGLGAFPVGIPIGWGTLGEDPFFPPPHLLLVGHVDN